MFETHPDEWWSRTGPGHSVQVHVATIYQGFYPSLRSSYAIHSWIIRPCPGMSHARLASSRLSWLFLPAPPLLTSSLMDFPAPSKFTCIWIHIWKVPGICWWLCMQRGHLHIYHAVPPKTQISSAFCLLLVCFVADVHIFRLLLPEHSLCPAFAEFCWLKLAEKARPATKSIYTAFVATTTTTELPDAKCLMLVSTFFWQVSICSVSGGIS